MQALNVCWLNPQLHGLIFSQVSRAWRVLAEDSVLWFKLCVRDGYHQNASMSDSPCWKSMLRDCRNSSKTVRFNWKVSLNYFTVAKQMLPSSSCAKLKNKSKDSLWMTYRFTKISFSLHFLTGLWNNWKSWWQVDLDNCLSCFLRKKADFGKASPEARYWKLGPIKMWDIMSICDTGTKDENPVLSYINWDIDLP